VLHLLYLTTNILDEATIRSVSTSRQVLEMSTLDPLKKKFKNELNTKRAELELSQEEMAEKLNISLRSYSNLEHGVSFCSALSLINYVNNCNVDKDKLFSTFAEIMNDAENQ